MLIAGIRGVGGAEMRVAPPHVHLTSSIGGALGSEVRRPRWSKATGRFDGVGGGTVFSRQPRAASSSEVTGKSVLFSHMQWSHMQWRTLPHRAYGRRGWHTVGLTGRAMRRTVGRATRCTNRWTLQSADGRRGCISMDIEAPRLWSLQPE